MVAVLPEQDLEMEQVEGCRLLRIAEWRGGCSLLGDVTS